METHRNKADSGEHTGDKEDLERSQGNSFGILEPTMSTTAGKDSRKREAEQSPIKKKFKDSAISREDLDAAIANGIKLALKEQQSRLDSVVASTLWFDSVHKCCIFQLQHYCSLGLVFSK
ncbi:unnamed protein product [Leuciscus chuanchicus]